MASERSDRLKGLGIVALAVLVLSPDSLLVRLSDSDPYGLMVVRGLLMGFALSLALAVLHGPVRFLKLILFMGRPGLWATLLYGLGNLLFIVALEHTSVANVLVMIATEPVFAAILAWLFLREPTGWATGLAIAGGLAGIAIVVSDSLGQPTLLGDAAALLCALMMAGFFVVLRHHRHLNMVPAVALSGLVSSTAALLLLVSIGPGISEISGYSFEQWGWIVLNSTVVLPLSFGLMALGPRYLPAAEIGLLLLLETVLGPIWVWWALGETPSDATLIGGAVVLGTLALHALWGLRQR